jgi:hypothetical protein
MNTALLAKFIRAEDSQIITVPEGVVIIQGHIEVKYPQFHGKKSEFIDFYEDALKDHSESTINTALYEITDNIIYS